MLDDLEIPSECPKCGSRLPTTLDAFAESKTVRCPRGHEVTLEDEGGNAREARAAARELDEALDGLSRTIKFKL